MLHVLEHLLRNRPESEPVEAWAQVLDGAFAPAGEFPHGADHQGIALLGRYVPGDAHTRSATGSGDEDRGAGHRTGSAVDGSVAWNKWGTLAVEERGLAPAWVFQAGYSPRALRQGWWVILDEINLAEPQVLERLNPVLEQPSSLV